MQGDTILYFILSRIHMEPEGLLLCPQEPAIDPYPEPVQSSPHLLGTIYAQFPKLVLPFGLQ
jgi:hypothetical protein